MSLTRKICYFTVLKMSGKTLTLKDQGSACREIIQASVAQRRFEINKYRSFSEPNVCLALLQMEFCRVANVL